MNHRRIIICLGVTGLMFLICVCWPLNEWFRAFLKLQRMRLPYLGSFFLILFFVSMAAYRYVSKSPFPILLLIGALVGQVAATISLSIANLFIENGLDRTVRSIQLFGVSSLLLTDLSVAFILGGWLFGMVIFALVKFLEGRLSRAGTKGV